MRRNLIMAFGLAMAALSTALFADTVVLKTGEAMEGKVLKNDDAGIVLEVIYGTLLIPKHKILRLEMDTPEMVAERERKEAEAKELAEKMRAQGLVLYKGKWVSEAEKAAAEAKLAEDKKKREEARAAAAAAAAAKKAAEEAQAAVAAAQPQKKPRPTGVSPQSALNSMLRQGNISGVNALIQSLPNGTISHNTY